MWIKMARKKNEIKREVKRKIRMVLKRAEI
jgi:hypothetical protein